MFISKLDVLSSLKGNDLLVFEEFGKSAGVKVCTSDHEAANTARVNGLLPFSLNFNETLSLMFFLIGFEDIAVHCSSMSGSWILLRSLMRPQTKFLPRNTIPFPFDLNSSANCGKYEAYKVGESYSDLQKKLWLVPSRSIDFT